MAVRAKELRYAVDLTADGELRDENGVVLDVPAEWSPEHLLLAALVRCSLKSLGFHAGRKGVEVRAASGSGRTFVTQRETDDRYALVETEVELAVELVPEPERDRSPSSSRWPSGIVSSAPPSPPSRAIAGS